LFIPPIDPEDVIWSGLPILEKEAMEKSAIELLLDTQAAANSI
jgi:Xaa-Pro dipeptidase